MASPFRIFRKHQKQMIAVLGVMTMFAFVFLGQKGCDISLLGRNSTDPVVASTTQYGNLRNSDLQVMINLHRHVLGFMERLVLEANPMVPPERRRYLPIILEQRFGRSDPNGVLTNWLLAQRAQQLGIVVSDQTVKNFIGSDLGGDQVPLAKIKTILSNMGLGQRQLIETLRNLLLAQRLQNTFDVASMGLTPAQRWDYYQRLKRTATVETAAIPVEKFTAAVKDPGNAVLEKFFEAHKGEIHDPDAPAPGFREPDRIAFEYFKAEVDKFVDPKSVSDIEVQKYYDEHKQYYAKTPGLSLHENTPLPPSENKPLPPKPTAPKPTSDVKKQAVTVPQQPAASRKTAPAEQKKPAADSAPKAAPEKKGDAGKKSSTLRWGAKFQWTADKKEVANEPAKKEAPKKVEPKKEPEKKAVPVSPPPTAPREEYMPLEQVKEEIRNVLAEQKAHDKILEIMTPLRDQINAYAAAKIRYDQDQKTNPNLQPPKLLDLKALAQAKGMSHYQTKPISKWQARDRDIAKSYVDERIDFVSYAYRPATTYQSYQPTVSDSRLGGSVFLFWKTEDQPEYTPKFDDPGEHEKVLQQWKQIEARKLANDEAARLAKKARDEKKSLQEALKGEPGMKVVESKPFSWLTAGMPSMSQQQPQLNLSPVEGIDGVGPDFMQAVFGLEPGEITVAMNYAKTTAYVVRVVQFAPPPSVLTKEFEDDKPNFEQNSPYNLYPILARQDRSRLYLAWLQEIRKQAGFKYTPAPDALGHARPVAPEESAPSSDMDF
jgi:hypothetical protein